MRTVRTRLGSAQVATLQYSHPRGLKDIRLVGVMHFAEADFWANLNDSLHALEDDHKYAIHYEMVENNMGKDAPKITFDLKIIQRLTGLIPQYGHKQGMDREPTWDNHDVTLSELVDLLGPKNVERMVKSAAGVNDAFDDPENEAWLGNLTHWALRHLGTIDAVVRKVAYDPATATIIIGHRNELAVDEMLITALAKPVVAVWGAAHLPGMHKLLRKQGYVLTDKTWQTVIRRKNRPSKSGAGQPATSETRNKSIFALNGERTYYSLDPAPAGIRSTHTVGDIWYQIASDKTLTGKWEYTPSGFVAKSLQKVMS